MIDSVWGWRVRGDPLPSPHRSGECDWRFQPSGHTADFSGNQTPCGSAGKEFACNSGDLGSIPGLGRCPGEGNGYPLQYSGLENSMDCIVHGVPKSGWQLFKIYPSPTCSLFRLCIYSHQSLLSLNLHSIFIDIPAFSFSSWSIVFVFLGSVLVGGYTLFFTWGTGRTIQKWGGRIVTLLNNLIQRGPCSEFEACFLHGWCVRPASWGQCLIPKHNESASVGSLSCVQLFATPPGSSLHGILQARILEWVTIPFSRGSSQPRGQTQVSCIAGRFLTGWATMRTRPCWCDIAALVLGIIYSVAIWLSH